MIKLMFLSIPFFFFFFPYYASAYTWQFTSQPRQCQNLSIEVQGSGQPPYSLLLSPSGPSPLPNKTDPRSVQNISFPGSSSSLSFNLNYPKGFSFVAVVSDSSGFGTGGTSTPVTVLDSSDSSCYDLTRDIQLPWFYYANPMGITQCGSNRWSWRQNLVNGTVNFYGVIPGGNSFKIPQGPLSTDTNGTGFNWIVDISSATSIIIIGGDDRGVGSGGAATYTVDYSGNSSCLNSTSPSSTAGTPAGGSYPTSTSDLSNGSSTAGSPAGGSYPTSTSDLSNGSSGGHSNTGLIAGGIAGGLVVIVAIALIAFFYPRRRGYSAVGRPVNVLHDDEDDHGPHRDVPHYYTLEPFLVPDLTIGRTFEAAPTPDRPITMTTTDIPRPAPMTTTHKNAPPPQRRTVNVIQHDDAGPSEIPMSVGEPETIELPPAYANIRPAQRPPGTVPTRTIASSTPALTKTTTS
ncbi:hypothetical protein EDB86DRAFT_2354143 [Lactarius hatsudake]|nr:hypothetical protein EDB86DRAFT_2354143 [Lactarius hatsudake]